MLKEKRIVVIGGGHGQAQICRGIKNIPNTHISAIVTVAVPEDYADSLIFLPWEIYVMS